METVPKRVVLDEELRRKRRLRVERDQRCGVQLFVRERTDRVGCRFAITAQESKRFRFPHSTVLLSVLRIHMGHCIPSHTRNWFPGRDTLSKLNFERIDARHMMNDHTDGASVLGHAHTPLGIRKAFGKDCQGLRPLFQSICECLCSSAHRVPP
jgi:hypothetical protein